MKITEKPQHRTVMFAEIRVGTVFKRHPEQNDVFMKVETEESVCLNTGAARYTFDARDLVYPFHAELIITPK